MPAGLLEAKRGPQHSTRFRGTGAVYLLAALCLAAALTADGETNIASAATIVRRRCEFWRRLVRARVAGASPSKDHA
jgi:hypothetical protein